MLLARPVVANKYWILKKDDMKIGEVEADDVGYAVKIGNNVTRYKTLRMVKQRTNIEFEPPIKIKTTEVTDEVNGYRTNGMAYNAIYDVKNRLPLYTRERKSKSWYAAGWYRVRQHRRWETVFCPKLITLQRYDYQGPFFTEEEAAQP